MYTSANAALAQPSTLGVWSTQRALLGDRIHGSRIYCGSIERTHSRGNAAHQPHLDRFRTPLRRLFTLRAHDIVLVPTVSSNRVPNMTGVAISQKKTSL